MALKEAISEAQKALSDSHLAIYDEKSYLMQLERDFALLKGQEASDGKKMKELSSLNDEVLGIDQTPEEKEMSKKF